ncbi:MAG: hypothetical protein L3J20_03515 [Flavobacteriaceae bacterium]|nr:hypothetical protein [Flavobacteriaceae bacterium]
MICFSYKISTQTSLQFEIENEEIQPEFEVLKPYFSKVLNSKFIAVRIQVGFEDTIIVSQLAASKDIDLINKEIVDSVKFEFVEHHFIKSRKTKKEETLEEISKKIGAFFCSEENLIDAL